MTTRTQTHLYLVRHGEAVVNVEPIMGGMRGDTGLTPRGVAQAESLRDRLAATGEIAADILISSTLPRARQTAEIIAGVLNMPVEIREEVNFDFDEKVVQAFVAANGEQDLMFVGHEPTMSQVIMALTRGSVTIKPGSLARVDITSQLVLRGELVWLIAPKVFDALGSDDA